MFINPLLVRRLEGRNENTLKYPDRFNVYFHDLYQRYQKPALLKKPCYEYHVLGDILFEELVKQCDMNQYSCFMFSHLGLQFDTVYAATILYFQEKYQLKGELIEINESGAMTFYLILDIASRLVMKNKDYKILCAIFSSEFIESLSDGSQKIQGESFVAAIELGN